VPAGRQGRGVQSSYTGPPPMLTRGSTLRSLLCHPPQLGALQGHVSCDGLGHR